MGPRPILIPRPKPGQRQYQGLDNGSIFLIAMSIFTYDIDMIHVKIMSIYHDHHIKFPSLSNIPSLNLNPLKNHVLMIG